MTPIESLQIQPLLLEILKSFDAYCRKNGISYVLSDGSLIGAVRHRGFIPWDDDIDVALLAEEYDKLLALAQQDPYIDAERRYKILLPVTLPNFYPFMKVIDTHTLVYEKDISRRFATGLWIDVFRYSPVSEDPNERKKLLRKRNRLQALNKIAVFGDPRTPVRRAAAPLVSIAKAFERIAGMNPVSLCAKIDDLQRSQDPTSELVLNIAWDYVDHPYKRSWFAQTIELEFEGCSFPAPARYHEVLQVGFGDYMQLPPVEQRVRHDFEAYFASSSLDNR